MSPSFVHLQCHSEYSLVDGLLRMKSWLAQVVALGMPAVAITDQCNLFGMVKFYKAALAAGVKPIIGCDVWIENALDPSRPAKMTLLCQNQAGYTNLTRLISKSYIEGQYKGKPIIKKTWLSEANNGLIALASSRDSDIAHCLQAGEEKLAKVLLNYWLNLFPGRFYLCVVRTNRKGEQEYAKQIITMAETTACPLVATNEVCFLAQDDYEAHEARVCINEGTTLNAAARPRNYSEDQYLKSAAEMAALFADIPEALANTVEIAKRCNLILSLDKVFLPKYPMPAGLTAEDLLITTATAGLEKRFARILRNCPAEQIVEKREQYNKRLHTELDVINKMGFAGYFLIVADFIRWAHENSIPVGPGRGSGAGSIVAYALEITALDPLPYDLLFERFLNPERVSMPDFDIDFCMVGRDRVIDYVHSKYGKDAVSQIITFGTMAAKAVIRDVGRVLGHPYGMVDPIAKLIPFELGITLEKALQQEEALNLRYKKEDEVKTLIDLAKKLEGITRNVGTHAGGVVIAPSKLTDYTPLYCENETAQPITQFDKYDIEVIGLVKFDFLGLRTLTIINWALQTVNEQRKALGELVIDLDEIPLDDPKPFELLLGGQTTAVFQLESRGMRDLIKRLQPDRFEDIIALVALFRPGPLQSGMVDDFIDRKKGLAAIRYLHPMLEPILQPTYGVILYQEQVMRIAQELAGYTLGAADVLRSAMGKKKPKEMAKQRKIFIKGAIENKIDKEIAESIFNLMEKFAGYGFNKSHSVAYALIAYQTAWLKAHFPAAFMAAVLSADMSNTDKIVILIRDCKELGLKIISPDVNCSRYKFVAASINNTIIYGLGAIKGLGEAAIESIVAARESSGSFIDLFDFCSRIDLQKVSKRALEALINAGALDCLGMHRAALLANLAKANHAAEQMHKNMAHGQEDLFGSTIVADELDQTQSLQDCPNWPEQIRLSREKAVLGLYLSGHPIDAYEAELHKIGISYISELRPDAKKQYKIAGFITAFKTRPTKKGDRMAFVTLEDRSGQQELMIFSDLLHKNQELLQVDNFILLEGTVTEDNYSGGCRFNVKEIMTLEKIRLNLAKGIEISVDHKVVLNNDFGPALYKILANHASGTCPIFIKYTINNIEAKLRLGHEWMFYPSAELVRDIEELGDGITVAMSYVE